jgi:hemolysin III
MFRRNAIFEARIIPARLRQVTDARPLPQRLDTCVRPAPRRLKRSYPSAFTRRMPRGMRRPWHCVKEPFPGISHLLGAVLGVVALVVLLHRAQGRTMHVIGFAVYGSTLILLFSASAMAHSIHCSPRVGERLDRLDYSAIFLLIAGTYTPICLVPLRGALGWALLAAVWSLAVLGILSVWIWRSRKDWARVTIYLCMGWLALLAAGEIFRTFPPPALGWLIGGGVIYSVGAVVFITDRPHLWPGRFVAHDLWHVMVLAGSACHFMVMLDFIAPHA